MPVPARTSSKAGCPAARWVDAAEWAKAFGAGRETAAWSGRIGGLGIGPASKVVVYDGGSVKDAARIWWILRYWGVRTPVCSTADGRAGKRPDLAVEAGKPQAAAATTFQAVPHASRLVDKKQLLAALGSGSLQIVDARSEGEFCGTDRQTNKHAGAIPGAKHLEWLDLIDQQTRRFKTAEELRPLFCRANIELQRPTAAHCQSGGRAAVMVFAMELMGAGGVSSYYAGWGEWGNADDTPIVVAPPKKAPPPTATKRPGHSSKTHGSPRHGGHGGASGAGYRYGAYGIGTQPAFIAQVTNSSCVPVSTSSLWHFS